MFLNTSKVYVSLGWDFDPRHRGFGESWENMLVLTGVGGHWGLNLLAGSEPFNRQQRDGCRRSRQDFGVTSTVDRRGWVEGEGRRERRRRKLCGSRALFSVG